MEQTTAIDTLDTARIICPGCKKVKILQLSPYPLTLGHTRVKYTCPCGQVFSVILEKKSNIPRETRLAGTYMSSGNLPCSGRMTIKKINSRGLTLKTNIEQKILPGLNLMLEFVLDDAKQSLVKKEIRILARNGRYMTGEFLSQEHYDNLGFYLFFNKLYV